MQLQDKRAASSNDILMNFVYDTLSYQLAMCDLKKSLLLENFVGRYKAIVNNVNIDALATRVTAFESI